jgi:hypothetical protein
MSWVDDRGNGWLSPGDIFVDKQEANVPHRPARISGSAYVDFTSSVSNGGRGRGTYQSRAWRRPTGRPKRRGMIMCRPQGVWKGQVPPCLHSGLGMPIPSACRVPAVCVVNFFRTQRGSPLRYLSGYVETQRVKSRAGLSSCWNSSRNRAWVSPVHLSRRHSSSPTRNILPSAKEGTW